MAAILVFFCFHENWPLWPGLRLNILLNFAFESEAIRTNLHGNKRILKWRPFWNKVYDNALSGCQQASFIENLTLHLLFFCLGTMLTMVLLMRALDPLKHEQETNLFLEKLVQVDGFRKGYYRDLSE